MISINENIPVEKKLFRAIANDVLETAKAVGLIYVTSDEPGFTRKRVDSEFYYKDGNKRLRDREHLDRIRSLVLPPAWESVWVCKLNNGHLQAIGYDNQHRKQYRYHHLWLAIRNQTKFYHMMEFGEKLQNIRSNLEKDLSLPGLHQRKVLAAMVSLLVRINIRVGNTFYEKLYGSFGLTTLKDHHVRINGTKLKLLFKGKKGILQNITFSSRKLSRIIQQCKDIPGKELFQYYDEKDEIRSVDSGMVNGYIKDISGGDFSAKDFRTWAGTIHALLAFKDVGNFETTSEMNRKISAVMDIVSKQLGNTRAVCKKYYVHPLILELYQESKLDTYIHELNQIEGRDETDRYIAEEKVLMKILRKSLV